MQKLMYGLTFTEYNGSYVVDSREVAKIMDREHKEIIKMIEGQRHADGRIKHVGILPTISESGLFNSTDYFMKSSYTVEGNNRSYPCYLLTRIGFEIVANRMTGKKGILFTAAYVTRYNEMEKELLKRRQAQVPSLSKIEVLKMAIEAEKRCMFQNELNIRPKLN